MTAGLLFHCHHTVLAEWTDNAEERAEYILRHKPRGEVELRLALLTLVPVEDLPGNMRDKAYAEWDKACAEWDKARAERDKACAEWAEKNHKRLCHPNCPWDGETIFAKGTSVAALAGERAIGCMFNELPKR